MRTTISLDIPLFKKIRQISHDEQKTMTRVVRELILAGIAARRSGAGPSSPFNHWHFIKSGARIDYSDKEALYRVLDRDA